MSELTTLSVIIPTYNSAPLLDSTLDSLLDQEYPNLEIIIVDAGSKDRTLEMLEDRFKVAFVPQNNLAMMLNKGLEMATSEYVTFLYPGDSYLSKDVLCHLGELAHLHEIPDLIFGGCLRRDRGREPLTILSALNSKALKNGRHPPAIQACFFLKSALLKIGPFDTRLLCKSNFDLFCRFNKDKSLNFIETHHILVDYDKRNWPIRILIREALEIFLVIRRYFGLKSALTWAFNQKPQVFISYLLYSFKEAFQKPN